jgi:hypothetical protein
MQHQLPDMCNNSWGMHIMPGTSDLIQQTVHHVMPASIGVPPGHFDLRAMRSSMQDLRSDSEQLHIVRPDFIVQVLF